MDRQGKGNGPMNFEFTAMACCAVAVLALAKLAASDIMDAILGVRKWQ
jgi:hypothetical protein